MGQIRHPQQGREELRRGLLHLHPRVQDGQSGGGVLPRTHVRPRTGDLQGPRRRPQLVPEGVRPRLHPLRLLHRKDVPVRSGDREGRPEGHQIPGIRLEGGRPGHVRARSDTLRGPRRAPRSPQVRRMDAQGRQRGQRGGPVRPGTVLQGRRRIPEGHRQGGPLAHIRRAEQAQGRADPARQHVPHRGRCQGGPGRIRPLVRHG